jgi:hypothetical protein
MPFYFVLPLCHSQMIHASNNLGNVIILYLLIMPPNAYAYRCAPSCYQSPPCGSQGTEVNSTILVAILVAMSLVPSN